MPVIYLGWFANLLLVYQWYALGHKRRHGLLIGVLASILWSVVAIQRDMHDLLFIEVVLAAFQLRAWFLWRSNGTDIPVHSRTSDSERSI